MPRLVTDKFKIHIAEQIVESVSEIDPTNLYLFIGKTDQWEDENDPPAPTLSIANTHFRYWDDILSAKKITPSDLKHVVPRIEWSFSSNYTAYSHDNNELFDQDFYVVTDDYNVYKCLQNNLSNGSSTVKPTGNGLSIIESSDGYKWKFMYSIKPNDILKFSNEDFIPVQKVGIETIIGKQKEVEDTAIDGAIDIISKTSNGHFKVTLKSNPLGDNGEAQDFIVGETLYGQISNTSCQLISYNSGNTQIVIQPVAEKFLADEILIGLTSGARAEVLSDPISTYEFAEGIFNSVENTTSMFLSVTANNLLDNLYVNSTIYITNNAAQGEQSRIKRYDSQSRKILIDPPFAITPNTSSGYIISPSIDISGDGKESKARILGNSTHGITEVVVSNKGFSYTYANSRIYANSTHGSGATAKPIIGPVGGHGKNAIEELNGRRLLLDVTLSGNEFGFFTISNDYRQFGLLRDPLNFDGNGFYTASYANQTIKLKLMEMSGRFIVDEKIYVGDTLNDSTANGTFVDFSYRDEIRLSSVFGSFTVDSYIRGETSGATAKIGIVTERDLKPYSGDILYVENKKTVQRIADQVENYKIILEF
jgi:hypothetical protein